MTRTENAVDFVVGCHHTPGVAISNGNLERLQGDFAQSAAGNLFVDEEPTGFLVIRNEVFNTCSDTRLLYGIDVCGGELSGQERILAVGLEIATTERSPGNAD